MDQQTIIIQLVLLFCCCLCLVDIGIQQNYVFGEASSSSSGNNAEKNNVFNNKRGYHSSAKEYNTDAKEYTETTSSSRSHPTAFIKRPQIGSTVTVTKRVDLCGHYMLEEGSIVVINTTMHQNFSSFTDTDDSFIFTILTLNNNATMNASIGSPVVATFYRTDIFNNKTEEECRSRSRSRKVATNSSSSHSGGGQHRQQQQQQRQQQQKKHRFCECVSELAIKHPNLEHYLGAKMFTITYPEQSTAKYFYTPVGQDYEEGGGLLDLDSPIISVVFTTTTTEGSSSNEQVVIGGATIHH